MIGKINNFVSKVVETVKGPLHSWGSKPSVKKSVVSKKVSKRKVVRKSRRN